MFNRLHWLAPLPISLIFISPGLADRGDDYLRAQYPSEPASVTYTPACYIQINENERLNLESLCNPPSANEDERAQQAVQRSAPPSAPSFVQPSARRGQPCYFLDENGRPCPAN